MKPSRLALTAAPFLALGLAACGSSGSTAASTAATPGAAASPAARFAAAADRVCAIQDRRETALGPGLVNADIVTTAHLPKAAAYLDKIVSIRSYGLPALRQLAATSPATDRAASQALVLAIQKVIADYHAAAQAAHHGDLAAFRAAFGKVAPHGMPTGPDAKTLAHAAAAFPFKVCGKGPGL